MNLKLELKSELFLSCMLERLEFVTVILHLMKTISAKVLLLGPQAVGKTSILLRQTGQGFSERVKSTIGAAFCQCTIQTNDDTLVNLQLWDTAGQERYHSLVTMYYRNAAAAFLIYDITDSTSFLQLRSWAEELIGHVGPSIVLCVIGNKLDLSEQRMVDFAMARSYADSINAMFCETSALNNSGISEAFKAVAGRIADAEKRKLADAKQRLIGGDNGNIFVHAEPQSKKDFNCC